MVHVCPDFLGNTRSEGLFWKQWASYQIRKYCGLRMRCECRERFPPSPRVSNPDMHRSTCVTHVPRCTSGSLTSDFLWFRWRGKRFWHSRRMRNPQFCVSRKRPMHIFVGIHLPSTLRLQRICFQIYETWYNATGFLWKYVEFTPGVEWRYIHMTHWYFGSIKYAVETFWNYLDLQIHNFPIHIPKIPKNCALSGLMFTECFRIGSTPC